jgi:hypothetical protein
MSRRVQKGRPGNTKLHAMGLKQGRHGKKGTTGMKRPGTSFGSAPSGYSSGIPPSQQRAAKGREESHPGHRMLAAGRRARQQTKGFGTSTR